ncbi:hypothetical protein MNEG_15394 [Monoraphidium neglectum]|uniref:Uncharacterized protein n=1 Tax=Monoraphidium neglectum TaxID=145388 RepID=A0A0D2MB66_9CHLO|nr:hypothetical protein MNEG_15394 [Monoraphidium neglectum]KIY92570.1 hypothetical protein MNEG_15394 [Monoraphidium neglectum]|eukprot:XP_013891590.1 hypothetical protein MNEG_15394 [Monoraphidium neglectum]
MAPVAPVMEWWASRPRRAGGRQAAPPSRDGSLAHGMWRPRGGGGGGSGGGRTAAAVAVGGDGRANAGLAAAAGAAQGPPDNNYFSLGRRIYCIEAPPGRPALDVDVVDLTCLATNVPAHRHSVHALNRDVLWDLHSIIADGRRAGQRTRRLERIAGNVYSFKTSPAHVHVDLL